MSYQKYSCQGCDRTDLTLTRNGKIRSHAPNGKRVGPDNLACGKGSEYPKESTEFHTHRFEYADDGHHMPGSFCECGMEEPDDAHELNRALHEEKDRVQVPPNPFRAPLPGGVWDQLPHDRNIPDSVGQDSRPAPAAPPAPQSADDFLDGLDEDAEEAPDHGPSYWPARYDGECSTCFAHFDAGDEIRRLSDGTYEAKECCGYGAEPQPDRPKSVARTLPVVRGRYKLPDPETGKPVSASRSSKFGEGIADSFMLDQWRHRMILVGVVNDPEILEKVRSGIRDLDPLEAVKERRTFLNDQAEKAMKAAGGDIRSGKGTKLHSYTEEVDAGTRELEDVPKEYRPDATAYRLALAECGFRPVKGLIERSVFCREMNVCGTFDRVLECVRTTDVLDLNGRMTTIHEGEFVIGDVKSGDNIKHPWLEILIQEALYAHAINENGVAVQDEPGGPFRWAPLADFGVDKVREDVGVVMHVPYGSGECKFYAADLITGWRGAKICKDNRDFWKIELPKVPIATYVVSDEEPLPVNTPLTPDAYEEPGSKLTDEQWETEPDDHGTVVVHPLGDEDAFVCACGNRWRTEEGANAYDHERDHCYNEEGKIIAGVPKGIEWWERAFRSVTTREGANACWREAKDAGIPADEIKRLVSLVQLEDPKPQTAVSRPESSTGDKPVAQTGGSSPAATGGQDGQAEAKPEALTLTERAHRVTTKAEARAVWTEAKDKIKELPEEKRPAARAYLVKLEGIMQERLATSA